MTQKTDKHSEDKRTNADLLAVAKNIRPLVQKILGQNGIMQVEMLGHWEEIIGSDLADYCFPEKIDFRANQRSDGVLHLLVPSGAFALELQHRETQILAKINTYFGYKAVSSLRIRQDAQFDFENMRKPKPLKNNEPLLVSDDEKNYIQEITNEVQNEHLKEILIKLGYSVFNENNKSDNK